MPLEPSRAVAVDLLRRLVGKRDLRSYFRLKRLSVERLFFRRAISTESLKLALLKLGVAKGRTVWVQSSWNEFYNFQGKPSDVIELMLDLIGPQGTLVMPAIPLTIDPDRLLLMDREPVSTGLICEIFRRSPGIKRSVHLSASVVALGPEADFLTRDHHRTETAWDKDSPFQRLMEVDALCVGMGVGRFLSNLTPLHAVESILRQEGKLTNVFRDRVSYRWRKSDGSEGEHAFLVRHGAFDTKRITPFYPRNKYTEFRLSNLWLWSISARDAIETGVELGRRGITMYATN